MPELAGWNWKWIVGSLAVPLYVVFHKWVNANVTSGWLWIKEHFPRFGKQGWFSRRQAAPSPVRLRWHRGHGRDKCSYRYQLNIEYAGPRNGEADLKNVRAWLTIKATDDGLDLGDSFKPNERPHAEVPGTLGGWHPRRIHGNHDERGTVTFDLSAGRRGSLPPHQADYGDGARSPRADTGV